MFIGKAFRPRPVLSALGVVAIWSAGTGATPAVDQDVRVATIGYRLATLGAQRCPRQAPLTGLLLHDLAAYDAQARAAVTQRFALGSGIGVRKLVPSSAASASGLAEGDEIQALNGVSVSALNLPPVRDTASYDRVEAFVDLLDAALREGDVTLALRRDGKQETIRLHPDMGCAVRFALLAGTKPEAWSDARYAVVNEGLANAVSDDELAFALAHETAHVVLGHGRTRRPILASLGIAGGKTRALELDADRLGARIMVDAGYSAASAETFLKRMLRVHGRVSLTHPALSARIGAIREAAGSLQVMPPS